MFTALNQFLVDYKAPSENQIVRAAHTAILVTPDFSSTKSQK